MAVNPIDELKKLTAPFSGGDDLFLATEHVPAALTPEPYKGLLAHDHHMTLAMEEYHGAQVHVRVLERHLNGDVYSRMILLERADTGRVVQFGLVRFDLSVVVPEVREEILSERTPLGRILINYNVLRHIDLGALLQVAVGPRLASVFECPMGTVTYGRLATIFCNRKPAVDLCEVSAPLGPTA